mgnify:FL=1
MKQILFYVAIIFISSCSSEKQSKDIKNITQQKLPIQKLRSMQNKSNSSHDPCSCNKKSKEIMDKTISLRNKFASMKELKMDKSSKKAIREFAIEYNMLVGKCFEANAAALFTDDNCDVTLKSLGNKKKKLISLGIQLDQGANIRL